MISSEASLSPTHHSFLGITLQGFHNIHYVEWGDPTSQKVAICVHGMSRNGRDFDYLAKVLVTQGYRVICPDLPGRGRSDWLKNPYDYNTPQHIQEMMALIARLNVESIDWIGTSLGGIMGIVLASYPNSPLRTLLLNDIGPYIPAAPLQRIVHYLKMAPAFTDKDSARKYLHQLLSSFGPLTSDQMDHLMEYGYFTDKEGQIRLTYDPQILTTVTTEDVNLWPMWESISCPVLVLRGATSTVLTSTIAERMLLEENVEMIEYPGIGHAPSLMEETQITHIRDWLNKTHTK